LFVKLDENLGVIFVPRVGGPKFDKGEPLVRVIVEA
jgi:hypothetical protein